MLKINHPELDFYGRLLTIEQALKSFEGRLRGVEYRISYDDQKTLEVIEKSEGITLGELKQFLSLVEGKIFALEAMVKDLNAQKAKLLEEIEENNAKLKAIEARNANLEKSIFELQKQKQNNPGTLSIKIPVDITGLVAAACMLIIAVLLGTNNIEILRTPAFSMTVGIAFIFAVAGKRLLTKSTAVK